MTPAPPSVRHDRLRTVLRWVLAALYLAAGIIHLRNPAPFLRITPDWVPWPDRVILVTGLCEIAGALALVGRRFRRAAAIGLAAYAVCVYPANAKHAIDDLGLLGGVPRAGGLGWAYHGPRALLQPVLVWWALFTGGVVDWPFNRRRP